MSSKIIRQSMINSLDASLVVPRLLFRIQTKQWRCTSAICKFNCIVKASLHNPPTTKKDEGGPQQQHIKYLFWYIIYPCNYLTGQMWRRSALPFTPSTSGYQRRQLCLWLKWWWWFPRTKRVLGLDSSQGQLFNTSYLGSGWGRGRGIPMAATRGEGEGGFLAFTIMRRPVVSSPP